ncbi:MAG: 4'-phosphopantetheinyl transferase superfamily protein [Gemmatimonadota bacterium]
MRKGSSFQSPRIGIDVVDLDHPACRGREAGDRLLDRILSDSERDWLEAGAADLWATRLWALWAAKEAAFKVQSGETTSQGVFRPSSLHCDLQADCVPDAPSDGVRVRFRGTVKEAQSGDSVRVEGSADSGCVQLLAWSPPMDRPPGRHLEVGRERASSAEMAVDLAHFRDGFTAEEWAGVHSVLSARVRLLARERIARLLLGQEHDPRESSDPRRLGPVEILTSPNRPGRTRPRVRIAGEDRPDVDVSLSHHGPYLAWAILLV